MAETSPNYNIGAIRQLLLDAFTVEDLPRFCLDHPNLRPIADRFGPHHGFDDMVDEVITYCRTQNLWFELLEAVAEANARQYARYQDRLIAPAAPPQPAVDVAAAAAPAPAAVPAWRAWLSRLFATSMGWAIVAGLLGMLAGGTGIILGVVLDKDGVTPVPTTALPPGQTPTDIVVGMMTDTPRPTDMPTEVVAPSDTPTADISPSPTATPTPSATATDTATPRPTASDTPTPTDTATRTPTPTATQEPIIQFWADSTSIRAGQSTYINWRVRNLKVQAIYVNRVEQESTEARLKVSPAASTTYELRLVHAGGQEIRRLTIEVRPATPLTIKLYSVAGLDGFRSNNSGGNDAVDIRVGNGPFVGDPQFEMVTRGFLSFDLSGLPQTAEVQSLRLAFYQAEVGGDPYGKLGKLLLKHVAYGDSLDDSALSAPALDSVQLAVHAGGGQWYTITSLTLADWIYDDLAQGRQWLQLRLEFEPETDGDGEVDGISIESGDNYLGTGNEPTLDITYLP